MVLLLVLAPLINSVLYMVTGNVVERKYQAHLTIGSMAFLLFLLLFLGRSVVEGDVLTVSLGTWAISGLLELN